ncbi:hypothetical protein CDD83_10134 [Cordyceps sp. RAO-2017]|nr:hypothetical protein CDD83_10134 [Cordyceps sp. RAO-2017]
MDPGRAPAGTSLQALSLAVSDGRLVVDAVSSPFQDEALAADEADVPESEIRRLLYTVENLRKQTGGGEDDGPEAGIEVEVKVDETRPVQE